MGIRDLAGGTSTRAGLRDLVYSAYEKRLTHRLAPLHTPRHVGVILDGNRRWARAAQLETRDGHQRGADKIVDLLGWCEDAGVEVVTLWLLSSDNLNRSPDELEALLGIISGTVENLAAARRWRLVPLASPDLLPAGTALVLKQAASDTADVQGLTVNVAVGYGGRQEIADAVRSLLTDQAAQDRTLAEVAATLDVEHIAEHLYTRGQPDPDLLIRTSGEQRLGGFLLWQSAHSEFYFCDAHWPDFRHVDFLRALRAYAQRERRLGR